MKPLQRSRLALRQFHVSQPTQIFRDVVGLAVTSNSYDELTEIRVLLYLKLEMYRELVIWADAIANTVYGDPELHFRMHQIANLIRKYPFPPELTGLNPREEAKAKFMAAERRCERVNRIFSVLNTKGGGKRHHTALNIARAWIRYVVGESPNLVSIAAKMDFSEGASIGVHGNATNLARKFYAQDWSVTPGCASYVLGGFWANAHLRELILAASPTARRSYDRQASGELYSSEIVCLDRELFASEISARQTFTCHNKISFVPKTAKTHRAIAVEPTLNTFVQRGIDQELRDRLKRVGLDLSDQRTNQDLAFLGSLSDEDAYCTIDLSSASDTLAREVVRNLLPPDWFDLLNHTRSPSYELDGTVTRYHKFVSMGNGFCFPLETLIFASLCHAAAVINHRKPDFRVYGDDIIVRRSIFHDAVALLRHCGFIPNPRKTFFEGPFRESCGADWHSGENVRPLVLDSPFDNLGSFFSFHNESLGRESRHYEYFREVREYLRKQVPQALRFVIQRPSSPRSSFCAQRIEGLLGIKTRLVVPRHLRIYGGSVPTTDSAFMVDQDEFLSSPNTIFVRSIQNWQSLMLRRSGREDVIACRDTRGGVLHHMACLRGSLSSKPFTLRYSAQDKVVVS